MRKVDNEALHNEMQISFCRPLIDTVLNSGNREYDQIVGIAWEVVKKFSPRGFSIDQHSHYMLRIGLTLRYTGQFTLGNLFNYLGPSSVSGDAYYGKYTITVPKRNYPRIEMIRLITDVDNALRFHRNWNRSKE